jgi:hypothetical protein
MYFREFALGRFGRKTDFDDAFRLDESGLLED